MATTKNDLVRSALTKLAVVGYDYDIDPEELRGGLITLEEMITGWEARGIHTCYALAAYPEAAQGQDDSEINPQARQAIVYALAIQLADSYGKQVSQSVAAGAAAGMNSLLVAIQNTPSVIYPHRMPRGSGNRRLERFDRFYHQQPSFTEATSCPPTVETLDPQAVPNELVIPTE